MPNVSELFSKLKNEEIKYFLDKSKAIIEKLNKGDEIFRQEQEVKYLFILKKGSVVVENIDVNGKRSIVNIFNKEGTVFGEVYLYIDKNSYDYNCFANESTEIIKIPKEAFFLSENSDDISKKILNNMLIILSNKAYYLNQKLLIFNSISLRQKISKYLLQNSNKDNFFKMVLKREELAHFLGATRPSVSRELMNMQKDGLIEIDRDIIKFDRKELEKFL
ncbi:Crp/Fnr family transcriptional regulator [Peptoniphilus sp. oral taxon 386]|uniref:Crp/Fnr family transcriptional regulator n=1 Tax=Peptoniphilus sp. oral taxon 386 TaxID=652713 RepID=UPI0001DA9CF6|nr:Crp/Fnr family transcriptional regulator [Peptoniphilus sp. oral taxon 386]EFI42462.1 cyclic nucleotide-binding domain protein [Peptoniphilus sp. oral taxon 386 str. F0131]